MPNTGTNLKAGAPQPELGTRPDAGFIALCEPNVSGNEWAYVKECLDTGWVSSVGSFVDRFERDLAAAVGARHAVATASGTVALHIGLLLAGVGPDDEVILPSLTFIAPANAVRYVGAWPVFVDVDPDYWQLDPGELALFLKQDCRRRPGGELYNRHTGRRVVAALPVDVLGQPCEHDQIRELATAYGLAVVEDATEALGATYRGRRIGQDSRLACFSFNGNKIVTTGGGGMIVTGDPELARRARYLTTQAKDDPIEFVHREIGFNYRLTNVQAAIGCAQLERLEEFVERKRTIARRYASGFEGCPQIAGMREVPWGRSTFWLYTILIKNSAGAVDRRALLERLAARNIQTRPLWQPLHQSPAHRGSFCRPCPTAEQVQSVALSLPCSTGLTDSAQNQVIEAVLETVVGRG